MECLHRLYLRAPISENTREVRLTRMRTVTMVWDGSFFSDADS